MKWKQSVSSITLPCTSTFYSLFLPFFVVEIFKFKYDKFFVVHSASISKFKLFEQPWPMHNHTKNTYNPGVVFKFLQYFNSDNNIYPTATIILKFWVVLEQTFYKKSPKFLWSENSYNLLYSRWLDKNVTVSPISQPPTPPPPPPPPLPFRKMFSRLEKMPLYSIADSTAFAWLQKYGTF